MNNLYSSTYAVAGELKMKSSCRVHMAKPNYLINFDFVIFSGTGRSEEIQRKYYSQLSKHEMYKLYQKYILDFQLYDYDPEMYYQLAFDA